MRRVNRPMRRAARLKTRVSELVVGTFNVRTLAFNSKNSLGHAEEMVEVCWRKGCRIVGLQETRRDGEIGFIAAGYEVCCRGSGGGGTEAKGRHGFGLTIKESILQDVQKDGLVVECISARLMKVRLNLKAKSNGISSR